jgi:hypothetical protein
MSSQVVRLVRFWRIAEMIVSLPIVNTRYATSYGKTFARVCCATAAMLGPISFAFAKNAIAPTEIAATKQAIGIELTETEQLAHPIAKGALGPWRHAQVVLSRPKGDDDEPFVGRVISRQADGQQLVHALPRPDEPPGFFYLIVQSMMFRNVDKTPEKELIILYLSHKIAPGGDEVYRANVHRWDGQKFERVREVEKLLFGAKNAAAVDVRLARFQKKK